MDKSFERYKLPKLTQEKMKNLNSPSFIKKKKIVV